VLSLLESDMVAVMKAIVTGTLDQITVEFSKKATVCKYAVPAGYPDHPKKDEEIAVFSGTDGVLKGPESDLIVYYSAVYEKDGKIYTTNSRSIGVVGLAATIEKAENISQDALDKTIKGSLFFRRDIGTPALVQKRIDHMKELRGQK